ncbi:G-protein coupled receptor 83-like [Clytia hemisphaerica]|uniref:G-protein coupled receptors family 1 profile domain-containing protein n=1 Tax=Clytia hemisphaerica TaxID=252671 RepID=A0A7M5WXB1_9CNID
MKNWTNNESRHFRCYSETPYFFINEKSQTNFIVIAIFDYLIAIPALLLNAAFLYTVYKHSKFRKSISSLLLVNLASLDLAISLISLPLHGTQMILHSMSQSVCWLTKLNDMTSFMLSAPVFSNLIFITIDTYCGIVFPFIYREHVARPRLFYYMWTSWIFLILGSILCNIFHLWVVYTLGYFILVCLAVIFFVVAYTHIYLTVSKIQRRVSCVSVASMRSQGAGSKERTIIMSLLIVLFFVISFLPSGLYYFFATTDYASSVFRTYMFPWTYSIRLSSSFVNSFIYYWRLGNIRKATIEILFPCCLPPVDNKAKRESYLRKVSIFNRPVMGDEGNPMDTLQRMRMDQQTSSYQELNVFRTTSSSSYDNS